MPKSKTKTLLLNSFWLSLLIHLLLLFFISSNILFKTEENRTKSPNLYVPSYVYSGKVAPTLPTRTRSKPLDNKANQEIKTAQTEMQNQVIEEVDKESITIKPKQKNVAKKSLLSASLDALRDETRQSLMNAKKEEEPIYLVGEENTVSDPLIKLLGKALSANFAYPRMAGEFGIQGRVIVRLTLHPEGYFSDVQMLESSKNRDLDAAALYAVNDAPTISGADRFLAKPRKFVIGFIFKIQGDQLVRFKSNED